MVGRLMRVGYCPMLSMILLTLLLEMSRGYYWCRMGRWLASCGRVTGGGLLEANLFPRW